MTLYRVFPFDPSARPTDPGGALFVPARDDGRIANPDLYSELYLSTAPAGAVSEAFGRFDVWDASMLSRYRHHFALAEFELDDSANICELDNAGRLLSYNLAPSDVVARDRVVTQAWAARIYATKKWIGISWWSRYDASWQSMGLWQRRGLHLQNAPEVLTLQHPALLEAAAQLPRWLA